MTPKEKAEELLKKMLGKNPNRQDGISRIDVIQAKQCALIAVDEMLSNDGWSSNLEEWNTFKSYFEEVKHEIEKL